MTRAVTVLVPSAAMNTTLSTAIRRQKDVVYHSTRLSER